MTGRSCCAWCCCSSCLREQLNNVWAILLKNLSKGCQNTVIRHMTVLYAVTFLLVLPLACHQLKYSVYFIRPQLKLAQERMRQDNSHRLEIAQRYLKMAERSKLHSMLEKGGHNSSQVDVALTVVTVSRNRHRIDMYEPRYLTQVVWRFLSLAHVAQAAGSRLHIHMSVCNVDPDPTSYAEARKLRPLIPVFNRFSSVMFSRDHPLEKEKQDYVFCLNRSIALNPRYVLLIEDDALPKDDFFTVLEHVVFTHLDRKFVDGQLVPNPYPGVYIKLYHPERLLSFISLEPERLPELFSIGMLFGTLVTFVYTQCLPQKNDKQIRKIWFLMVLYFILVALAIGRANLAELRRMFSPYLYSFVRAPGCCTPAMLFPIEGATQVAQHLQVTKCGKGFGKDMALDKWRRNNRIVSHMVQPNMVSHIGMYSALRSALVNPFIV